VTSGGGRWGPRGTPAPGIQAAGGGGRVTNPLPAEELLPDGDGGVGVVGEDAVDAEAVEERQLGRLVAADAQVLRAGGVALAEVLREEGVLGPEGVGDVSLRGAPVVTRGPGEFFGEIALIRDTPRTATVRAAEDVRLVVVDRADFLDSIGAHPRCTHTAHTVAEARLLTATEAAGT
jgi:CRP-like cAMP-binding protein